MPEQVEFVNLVASLQETNRTLNRRAQEADRALKEALTALQRRGWQWRGGNFGRAILAYYSTLLETETKQLREAIADALEEADYQTRQDAPGVEPDWAAGLRAAFDKPTESVADDE